MKRFLFICSRNQLRSPTAEQLFSTHPGLEVASAATSPDAVTPLSAETVERADTIFRRSVEAAERHTGQESLTLDL